MFHLLRPFSSCWSRIASNSFSSTASLQVEAKSSNAPAPPIPPAPQDCCMSGCDKCVWRVYAEELQEHLGGMGGKSLSDAVNAIQDPSLKMFIKMELKVK